MTQYPDAWSVPSFPRSSWNELTWEHVCLPAPKSVESRAFFSLYSAASFCLIDLYF